MVARVLFILLTFWRNTTTPHPAGYGPFGLLPDFPAWVDAHWATLAVALETTAEEGVVVASSAVTEGAAANPVAAVLVGLVASPAVVVGSPVAMPAAVVVELVANPAAAEVEMVAAMPVVVAAEVEMVVNTGRTEASFGAVLPPAVKLLGAVALHRRLRRPCLICISRSRGHLPLSARLIGVIG